MAYIADEACQAQGMENKKRLYEFNHAKPWETENMARLIDSILGSHGKNIEVGDNFFANYNLVILDVAKVTIGDNVFIAPNVAIYTAGHPVHYEARNTMYEYGIAVTIGDNCWIGGNTVICPSVKVGNGVVIGAGSVVTKDIPDNVIAAGNPCRVIRPITDEDKQYYFKKRKFDDEAMKAVNEYGKNKK